MQNLSSAICIVSVEKILQKSSLSMMEPTKREEGRLAVVILDIALRLLYLSNLERYYHMALLVAVVLTALNMIIYYAIKKYLLKCKWRNKHTDFCPTQFADKASVHLESAIAPQVVSDVLSRGVIISGLVSDGNSKTDDALKVSGVYDSLNREIERHECLSHVCKRLKINLSKAQDSIQKSSKSEKAFEKKLTATE